MKNKPEVSVIIASFNTKEITLACLNSLYEFTSGLDLEVIVVDNGSTDSSAKALTEFGQGHSNMKLIRSATNVGFGPANNLGAKEAVGEYLLFLNTDTVFIENCLPDVIAAIKNNKAAAVSCNLLNKDTSQQISGGYFPTLGRLLAWQFFLDDLPFIDRLIKSVHPHSPVVRPDWITGAFMLVPKKLFWEVGGFDEKIFMYTEEMELCYRLKKSGGRIILDPKSAIVHLGGASGGSLLAITAEIDGMVYFFQKHMPPGQLPLVKFIFALGSLLRLVIFGIIGGNATARSAYSKSLSRLT